MSAREEGIQIFARKFLVYYPIRDLAGAKKRIEAMDEQYNKENHQAGSFYELLYKIENKIPLEWQEWKRIEQRNTNRYEWELFALNVELHEIQIYAKDINGDVELKTCDRFAKMRGFDSLEVIEEDYHGAKRMENPVSERAFHNARKYHVPFQNLQLNEDYSTTESSPSHGSGLSSESIASDERSSSDAISSGDEKTTPKIAFMFFDDYVQPMPEKTEISAATTPVCGIQLHTNYQ